MARPFKNDSPSIQPVEPVPATLERELEAVQPALRAYVASLIGSVVEVADFVQETNLLIWKKRADFQPGTNFKAYAFRIAHWKVMSFRRDRARERKHTFNEQLLLELSNEAQAFFGHGTDSRVEALAICLRRLPAEHLSLLREHYSKGESLTEIALRTRRKPSALHKTLSRIRQALRHCINARMQRGHEPQPRPDRSGVRLHAAEGVHLRSVWDPEQRRPRILAHGQALVGPRTRLQGHEPGHR